MKILSAEQIRQLDTYTIEHEPIDSIHLMERASQAFVHWFTEHFQDHSRPVHICCGPGNNGGDGLAIARLLHERFYPVHVHVLEISSNKSEDYKKNLQLLKAIEQIPLNSLRQNDPMPELPKDGILIDAIFGSGLSRPVGGYWAEVIEYLNSAGVARISVDIPSGLFADKPSSGTIFRADYTISFQLPKLAFFIPENGDWVGHWETVDIGLHSGFLSHCETPYRFLIESEVSALLHPRHKFDHKGTYGHALLMAGSYGKVGACILSAQACLRSGVGLLTLHAPSCAYPILQQAVPEAMVSVDRHRYYLSELPQFSSFAAIGIGPGIDQKLTTRAVIDEILTHEKLPPMVWDADALNILSQKPEWLHRLPKSSILTPHPGEFSRLFGASANGFDRLELLRERSRELGVIIVLKGAHTAIALPNGEVWFNNTGNPGMATGGSGDVLTGIVLGLLAQGYPPKQAALLGVYLHGLAGDLASEQLGQEAVIAGDIVAFEGRAFRQLRERSKPSVQS